MIRKGNVTAGQCVPVPGERKKKNPLFLYVSKKLLLLKHWFIWSFSFHLLRVVTLTASALTDTLMVINVIIPDQGRPYGATL